MDINPIWKRFGGEPIQKMIEAFPGWAGRISREDAENLLQGKPVGTYLLREGDSIDQSIAAQLTGSDHPVILTAVAMDERISEHLILHTKRGWILYRDEPNLDLYQAYPTPTALISSLGEIAINPLR